LESLDDDALEQLSLYHTHNYIQNDNLIEGDGHLGDIYQLEPKQKPEVRIWNHRMMIPGAVILAPYP
jgi:hypothetical protein